MPGCRAGATHGGLAALVTRPDLPPAFQRWRLTLAPGAVHPTDEAQWAGALVLVEGGRLEVRCRAGGRCTFGAGALLALGCMAVEGLANPGRVAVRLVAVRRRSDRPAPGWCR